MTTRTARTSRVRTLVTSAAIAVAAVGLVPAGPISGAAAAPSTETVSAVSSVSAVTAATVDPMVSHARRYLGTRQGQCKVFVQKIHAEVYANTLGTGYYQAYLNAGYHRVTKANIKPGDVVQETNAAHTLGIHTAIVTGNPSGADVRVIDSNFVSYETVGEHVYNPDAHAASHGGVAYYWRK
ncbi:MAG: hypothetical protein ABIS35_07515 [Terracoccus sp.]